MTLKKHTVDDAAAGDENELLLHPKYKYQCMCELEMLKNIGDKK